MLDLSKPITSQVKHNLTRKECKDVAFSGIRRDEIGGCYEIWLIGSVARTITDAHIQQNPNAMARAYEDLFQLHPGTVIP